LWNSANYIGLANSTSYLQMLYGSPEIGYQPDWTYFDETKAEYWLPFNIGMVSGSNLAENLDEKLKRVFPCTPCLVLITNTHTDSWW